MSFVLPNNINSTDTKLKFINITPLTWTQRLWSYDLMELQKCIIIIISIIIIITLRKSGTENHTAVAHIELSKANTQQYYMQLAFTYSGP